MENVTEKTEPILSPSSKVAAGPLKLEIDKDDSIESVSLLVGAVLVLYLGIRLIKKYV